MSADKEVRHQASMAKQKQKVDANIERAQREQGLVLLLTGDGKGKSSSAFGMVMRSLGYGHKVGIIQFIKGEQLSGEEVFIRDFHPEIPFYQMGTGFTWDTQDRSGDIAAAKATWQQAEKLLKDPNIQLLILDELTYMLAYDYLDEGQIIKAISERPAEQSVVITGRGGGKKLRDLADTVSEVKDIKHAFRAGIKARRGVDL
jgi:cob(I)alamin adenosyltransferase